MAAVQGPPVQLKSQFLHINLSRIFTIKSVSCLYSQVTENLDL